MTYPKITCLSVCLCLALTTCTLSASCKIVENGKSQYKIILQPGFSPSEKLAAQELQSHIQQACGCELPIEEKIPQNHSSMIVLGQGEISENFNILPDKSVIGPQGAKILTSDGNLFIVGTKEGGTLNGVYRFLEDYVAVRWLAPDITQLPSLKNLTLPQIDRIIKPAFAYRETTYYRGYDRFFLARKMQNYGSGGPQSDIGNQISFYRRCHSYYAFINPDEYYDEHPEYFSEIGGKRVRQETQLCLTNPQVLDIVTQKMLQLIKNNPDLEQYNFSQMDFYNYCQCDKCQAMNEKYKTNGATQFWFVNQLAERISKVYPDKQIGTLAYTFTEDPPIGMTMHPNAAIWLCHMFPCCDSHPIDSCPKNAAYKNRVKQWSRICEHLYIWHYITDFAHYYNPFPNFRAIANDIKFYRDNGVEGLFLQGMGDGGKGGEFSLLRPYYAMKLAWNPDLDPDAVINEFLEAYYGPAAKPIAQYVKLLHDEVENKNIHMHLYTNPGQGYLSDEIIAESQRLFDQAQELVKDDPELLERVKVARMPLVYARLFPRNGYSIKDGWLEMNGQIASLAEIQQFVERMKQHGFMHFREAYGNRDLLVPMAQLIHLPKQVWSFENNYLRVDIVPMLAGRILKITDKKSGKCVTSNNNIRSLFFPLCGGFENRVGESFFSWGWYEPGFAVKRSADSLAISIKTMDGYEILRTVTLEKDSPVLNIKTELKNTTDKPKASRLQSHLELDTSAFGDNIKCSFTNLSGEKITNTLADIVRGMREGKYYRKNEKPAGKWSFSGTNGLNVTHEFDLNQTDFSWLVCYPRENNDLEINIWLKNAVLAPGESIITNNKLTITSE